MMWGRRKSKKEIINLHELVFYMSVYVLLLHKTIQK